MNRNISFTFFVLALLLTGCWDENPIEDYGFVVGVAIDMADKQGEDGYSVMLTSQFVVPSGFGTPGQGGGGGGKEPYMNLSSSGESLFSISREMSAQTSLIPFYEHLKVVIVSSEVAKEPGLFSSIMDGFIRDHEMRRGIQVVISEGEAKEVLELAPENVTLPAVHVNKIMQNTFKSIEVIEPVRIGALHEYLLNESSYVMPITTIDGNKLSMIGAGIIHGPDNRLIGTLNGDETKGLNLIKGDVNGGTIKFEIDGRLMIFEIAKAKSNINIDTTDPNNMNISITIDAEGTIAEMFGSKSMLNKKYQAKIEEKVGEKIEELAKLSLKKGQTELNIDIYGFDGMLRRNHYKLWEKIRDEWTQGDNLFSKSTIDISAKAIVRDIGASDRTKSKGVE